MKIIDKIENHKKKEKLSAANGSAPAPFFSLEFFPPKTEAGVENLYMRMERMIYLEPLFIDVTWGAGGSTKDLSMAISQYSQTYFGTDVLMHLTCTNLTVDEIKEILSSARAAGIQNILALRGDPPKGAFRWSQAKDGLSNAIDLVKLIRQEHGDYFCIAVAGFPEGHPSSAAPLKLSPTKTDIRANSNFNADKDKVLEGECSLEDIGYLRDKIAAGADFILTQFFYDTQVFLRFLEMCRENGIACPIIPGIMPIQGYNSFVKMSGFCRTKVPEYIWADLKPFSDDDERVKDYGVQLCGKICKELQDAGVPGFHFYTLNLEKSVTLILDGLQIKASVAARRALPWRGSRTGRVSSNTSLTNLTTLSGSVGSNGSGGRGGTSLERDMSLLATATAITNGSGGGSSNNSVSGTKVEDVRPINWANRPKSYIKRTFTWDEFPNGRWGDGRSPAFGELSDSHFFRPSEGSKEDRLAMWGESPIEPEDVYEVFVSYVEGKIPILPWCETPLHDETHSIDSSLAAFNRAGFLTINSQPAINGVKSDDPVFGWGGPDGRVYQKAYIEFFTSPALLQIIIEIVREKTHLNVHAVDSSGQSMFSGAKGVTALTWGVFPNKEVIQPTIFDSDTFLVWSEEAFALWTDSWASLYDDETDCSALLYDIHDTYSLVAIVDNDYIDSDLYTGFVDSLVEAVRIKKERESTHTEGIMLDEETFENCLEDN